MKKKYFASSRLAEGFTHETKWQEAQSCTRWKTYGVSGKETENNDTDRR